jgi:hypothetical protein
MGDKTEPTAYDRYAALMQEQFENGAAVGHDVFRLPMPHSVDEYNAIVKLTRDVTEESFGRVPDICLEGDIDDAAKAIVEAAKANVSRLDMAQALPEPAPAGEPDSHPTPAPDIEPER